ncbi:MAG: hypothetical protein KA792_08585, partial [Bacteroidales bacterium]|nr:hypothetical protein [Bacteroidales bacterium]
MQNKDINKEIKKDIEISRCYGLAEGYANIIKNHKSINANEAMKSDGPFYCPYCLSDAIIRKCDNKKHHFAHKAKLSAILQNKDNILHTECINEILQKLKSKFPDGNW